MKKNKEKFRFFKRVTDVLFLKEDTKKYFGEKNSLTRKLTRRLILLLAIVSAIFTAILVTNFTLNTLKKEFNDFKELKEMNLVLKGDEIQFSIPQEEYRKIYKNRTLYVFTKKDKKHGIGVIEKHILDIERNTREGITITEPVNQYILITNKTVDMYTSTGSTQILDITQEKNLAEEIRTQYGKTELTLEDLSKVLFSPGIQIAITVPVTFIVFIIYLIGLWILLVILDLVTTLIFIVLANAGNSDKELLKENEYKIKRFSNMLPYILLFGVWVSKVVFALKETTYESRKYDQYINLALLLFVVSIIVVYIKKYIKLLEESVEEDISQEIITEDNEKGLDKK